MVISLLVLLGVCAFAVDLVHAMVVQQKVQNAADAASLGGVVHMPDDPDAAIALAKQVAKDNGFEDGVNGVEVIVTPNATNSRLEVQIRTPAATFFAGAVGVDSLTVREGSTAEFDPPAQVVSELDVVVIVDRTGSMDSVDVGNARTAANELLKYLDPATDRVALGLLGPSSNTTTPTCPSGIYGRAASSAEYNSPNTKWVVAPTSGPLSDTYQMPDGTLNLSNQVVRTIACFNTSGVGTNIKTPIERATAYLQANARPGATKAIIVETDGEPNFTGSGLAADHLCGSTNDAATAAKNLSIVVKTIGFFDVDPTCRDTSGPYVGRKVTRMLADMASPIDGVPAVDNGCGTTENTDDDGYFCVPKSGLTSDDLAEVFVSAASQVSSRREPRLVG
jgi:Flp pilus assembly protein TadG